MNTRIISGMSLCCEEKANKMPDEKKTQTVTVISFVTCSFSLWFDHLVVEVHGNWIYTRLRVVSYFVDSGEIRVRACVRENRLQRGEMSRGRASRRASLNFARARLCVCLPHYHQRRDYSQSRFVQLRRSCSFLLSTVQGTSIVALCLWHSHLEL